MILPGFIIVGSFLAKGSQDSAEIMFVFETHVFFDKIQPPVATIIIGSRLRKVIHHKYRSMWSWMRHNCASAAGQQLPSGGNFSMRGLLIQVSVLRLFAGTRLRHDNWL
jgi:hypothetical protein